MNLELRDRAIAANLPLMDYILAKLNELELSSGKKRTIFAACPNSISVIKAALKSAKRCNAPIKFAATLNQIDLDGGYTGLNQNEFVKTIHEQARVLNVTSPVIIAIDHGGPWLKDLHANEKWSYTKTDLAVKKSFESAILAGYDLIHVDPTVDITLRKGENISIKLVAERTVDLIIHCETFRRDGGYPRIAYEVGTEEVHGGLADKAVFKQFLDLLKIDLKEAGYADVWPCFVVGKVGTDLHTTIFDPGVAKELTFIAQKYGSLIKGHYSDNVSNPEDYPISGMGAANVGPEFTEMEYEGLCELERIQEKMATEGKIAKPVKIKKHLREAVVSSGRWQKWVNETENREDFYANPPQRQEWFIKTGCRYIWEKPEIVAARARLSQNLAMHGIDSELLIESHIESAMDKYFYKFNLVGLNELL